MQSLQIPDTKDFMNKLLNLEVFDPFLVSEASVTTFTTFQIDGSFHSEYYGEISTDTQEGSAADKEDGNGTTRQAALTWRMVRPIFFDLIKGKHTPLNFKIVFRLADYNVEKLLTQSGVPVKVADVAGLFLNIHYNGKETTCTTGTSLRVFTLDKSLDQAWDSMVQRFFKKQMIPFLSL